MSHLPPRLRIILVDDQPLFRKALASLIDSQPDMQVVAQGESGPEALDLIRRHEPDLLVMDVQMPGGSGADGVRRVRAAGVTTPIVMLTISDEDDDLFDCIRAGADGYLLKNMRPEALFEDLRAAARGEAPVAPSMAGRLLEWFRTGGGPSSAGAGDAVPSVDPVLTRREAEILQLVAAGLSNKEIAARLVITEGTVKNHVHNSLEKLHLTNRVQAAAYAVRQGAPTHLPD